MTDLTQHYTYFLEIYFKTTEEPFIFKIRKKESERFKNNLESYNNNKNKTKFFIGDTIEGKYIGINLSLIQLIRVLWEPLSSPEDEKFYEGPIKIYLLNRKSPILADTVDPDILVDIFHELEHGPEIVGSFVTFIDEDGEEVIIKMEELLYIECPKSLAMEGWQIINERDEMDT